MGVPLIELQYPFLDRCKDDQMKIFYSMLLVLVSTQCVATSQLENLINEVAKTSSSKATQIRLSDNLILPAEVAVSPKGNGSLVVSNLELMVYDNHDNGMIYGKEGVSITLTDLDSDGVKEIVISGVLVFTGEEESDPKNYSHFVRGYKYNTSTNKFKELLAVGDYQPDINAE